MAKQELTVVQLLPELDEGGVEGETLDLAIYLANHGYRSIVISGGGRLVPVLEKNGCQHIHWPFVGEKSFRCLPYILKLRNYLLQEHVDVLHLRSRLPAWIGYLAWKSLPYEKRPSLITTFHGFYSVNSYSAIMTKGERVAAVSETIKSHIVQNYRVDSGKISLIHGGFDTEIFSPENVGADRVDKLRDKWLTAEQAKGPVIVLPGRLTQWKGQDVFIESLARLKQLPFTGLMIGDTEEHSSYTRKLRERLRHHQMEDRILLVGHCSDMPAALMLSDLVVSASSTQPEAFGKVAIEAMAMAKPVIATAHGGSLETVIPGVTGWLVPPLDVDAMTTALREALSNPVDSARLGQEGRRWVNERFTARAMCEKTVELYREAYEAKLKELRHETLTVMQLLPELNSGGVERGTLEMGRHLVRNGHRSIVVSGGGRLVSQLEREGSLHVQKSIGSKSPIALFHIWPLRRLIVKERVSVLHLRSRMPAWIGYVAWKTIPVKRRPVLVTTFHGFYSVNAYSAIMTKGDGVIAISESIRRHIFENYDRDECVRLIFRGVDGEIFDPVKVAPERIATLHKLWQIDAGRPVLMLPGRLTRLKGQELFLQSLLRVKTKNYQAILVGDTEDNPGYTSELKQFIKNNQLNDHVKLVGHCSDMPAAFLLADIVLSTSSLEPEAFGRTTVEAMAMGRPVIATAHGGSLETVKQDVNGWLVKPGDVDDLASAIDKALALGQNTLEKFGEEGQKQVRESFTAQAMCERTVQFYNDLFKRRQTSTAD